MRARENNLDYTAALLHGRRSRLVEGERLKQLCELRSLSELAFKLNPEGDPGGSKPGLEGYRTGVQEPAREGDTYTTSVEWQRRLVEDLIAELVELRAQVMGAGARFLDWMLARFEVENLKVLIRGFAAHRVWPQVAPHLVSLPVEFSLDGPALFSAGSLGEFIVRLPQGVWRDSLEETLAAQGREPFFMEAAADRGYFRELLARVHRLTPEEREVIQPLVSQEVDIFHLMLVTRGRFHYELSQAQLLPLHVDGTATDRARFMSLLTAPHLGAAAQLMVGQVVDALPTGVDFEGAEANEFSARLELLAWARFRRLANSAFRRSPINLGAVAGYLGLRRVEVANLIAISEGIRAGLGAQRIQAHLIPTGENGEAAYA